MINLTEEKNKKIDFKVKTFTVVTSAILFMCSLTQIAFHIKDSDHIGQYSIGCLLFGWLAIPGPGILWLANPLLLFSWIALFKNIKKAFVYSTAAFALAICFIFFRKIKLYNVMGESDILSLGLGYWLWVSSCFTNLIGISALYLRFINNR